MRRRYSRYESYWPEYVPVSTRKQNAAKEMKKLMKKGQKVCPVVIDGRLIARSFWGKSWCEHLESFSDYENRLPRGRSYVRNGSVCHLEIKPGKILAMVSGTSLYEIEISIKPLTKDKWITIKQKCSGQIGSIIELLQGKLSDQVMTIVTDQKSGLFPLPGEIDMSCSCPDWATMCKHVAAVMYGVGNRLDEQPELLFTLRGVDAAELIAADIAVIPVSSAESLSDDALGDIFGVEMDGGEAPPAISAALKPKVAKKPKKSASETKKKDKINVSEITGTGLIQIREKYGLTRTVFAKYLHIATGTLARFEKTKGILNLSQTSRIHLETLLEFGLDALYVK